MCSDGNAEQPVGTEWVVDSPFGQGCMATWEARGCHFALVPRTSALVDRA